MTRMDKESGQSWEERKWASRTLWAPSHLSRCPNCLCYPSAAASVLPQLIAPSAPLSSYLSMSQLLAPSCSKEQTHGRTFTHTARLGSSSTLHLSNRPSLLFLLHLHFLSINVSWHNLNGNYDSQKTLLFSFVSSIYLLPVTPENFGDVAPALGSGAVKTTIFCLNNSLSVRVCSESNEYASSFN